MIVTDLGPGAATAVTHKARIPLQVVSLESVCITLSLDLPSKEPVFGAVESAPSKIAREWY